ncbi:MAG TPA: FAD-dependent oxidoreductase, partial [Proteobacteria bacterium]|nr:FAD-dependent oxidoreductase [Pseudomonadota bacterium]
MAEFRFDFLVIGSGIAGLNFARKVARFGRVAIVTKRERHESETFHAQGGIASVLSSSDSFELHIQDTLKAGCGLCNEKVVRLVVESGPRVIKELVDLGVPFTKVPNDKAVDNEWGYDLGKEGGHSCRRIVHAGDLTGREIEKALLKSVEAESNVKFFEHHIAIDLITMGKFVRRTEKDICLGAYVLDKKSGEIHTFLANATILATGGAGKVYLI